MASILQPNVQTYKAGGTIVAGHAVKFGADAKHVVECTAATDHSVGIALSGTSTLEDPVEVCMPGGGAKAVCHGTSSPGDVLVPFTDGTLSSSASNKDRIIAVALQDGVAGDVISVSVVPSIANI